MARNTKDSNVVGLYVAEEDSATPGTLPGSPIFYQKDPNGIAMGPRVGTKARRPLSQNRQVQKPNVVSFDADGTFRHDLVPKGLWREFQAFLYTSIQERATTAPLNDLVAAAVAATNILTATGNPAEGATVVIGGQTYTFTATVDVANEVLIGATASDSLTNLVRAITAGAGSGTLYGTGTVANAYVTAAEGAGDTVDVTALIAGTYGNSIATTETSANLSWATATLTGGVDSSSIDITAVDGSGERFQAANGLDRFAVNDIIFAEGFTNSANNGIHVVTAVGPTSVTCGGSNLVTETPPAAAKLSKVGYQFAAGTLSVTNSGSAFPTLNRASGAVDFSALGLRAGHWIRIGGDTSGSSGNRFTNAANNGEARVYAVATNSITLDQTRATMVTEAAGTLAIQIFMGDVIENADAAEDVERRTFHVLQTLGEDDDGEQGQFLTFATPNRMNLTVAGEDFAAVEFQYIAAGHDTYTGAEGPPAGDRVEFESERAFNTVSNLKSLRLVPQSTTDANPTTLSAYLTEFNFGVDNGAKARKALGNLQAIDVGLGDLVLTGGGKVYFDSVDIIGQVTSAASLHLHAFFVQSNKGILFDIPEVTIGCEAPALEQNEAIELPVDIKAAEHDTLGITISITRFKYLPSAAN